MSKKDYTTFEPWFGKWPPEIKEGGGMSTDKDVREDKWYKRWPLMLFVYVGFIGLFLLLLSAIFLHPYPVLGEIIMGLGIAGLSAGIIGGIIELAFVEELGQHVAEKAFGFLLPPEIREEISWIYGIERLATEYHHFFRFEKQSNDKVWVYETVERTVKNISNKPIDICAGGMGIQEWFHKDGRSEIIDYELTGEDGVKFSSDSEEYILERPHQGRPQSDKQSHYIINIKETKLDKKLGIKKHFTWTSTYRELRPVNADTVFWSGIPSINPHVVILNMPDDMDCDVTFSHRNQAEIHNLGSGHWRLDGMLLPGQALRLRWWVKADSNTWRKEFDEKQSKQSNQERL